MKIDFCIVPMGADHGKQRTHYIDHAAPVYLALPEETRGEFMVIEALAGHARRRGVYPMVYQNPYRMEARLHQEKRPVLVVGHADPRFTMRSGRPNAILMHGVGFTFDAKRTHPSYPGTTKYREFTRLMLATNETIAGIERAANPGITVEVVGCPKLDRWHTDPRPYTPKAEPVVAAAWHWDCRVSNETRTAFYEYRAALRELAREYRIIGHGHPHIIDDLEPLYQEDGIEVVRDLDEVFARADAMIFDGTSAGYEFASLDRPVVVCQKADYRKINYGGMFHLRERLGVLCETPGALRAAVELALTDPEGIRKARREVVAQCYAYTDGHCAERAAAAILQMLHDINEESIT